MALSFCKCLLVGIRVLKIDVTYRIIWVTVVCVMGVVFLSLLGYWQLTRLQWKVSLITNVHHRQKASVVPLTILLSEPHESIEYRRVFVKGSYLFKDEIFVGPRVRNYQMGHIVFTPMRLESGEIVLINRGWISQDQRDRLKHPKGKVTLFGTIQREKPKGVFTADNNPQKNSWIRIDLKEISETKRIFNILPLYIIEDTQDYQSDVNKYPTPMGVRINIPNNHLLYALTWFALAFALGVMYLSFLRKSWLEMSSSRA